MNMKEFLRLLASKLKRIVALKAQIERLNHDWKLWLCRRRSPPAGKAFRKRTENERLTAQKGKFPWPPRRAGIVRAAKKAN